MGILSQYSTYIVCILAAILGYGTGRWHQLFLEKRNITSIRFQKLYAPFEKEYLKAGPGAFLFTDLSDEKQKIFQNMLIDNYEYTDSALKTLIYEFRCAIFSGDTDDVNRIFFEIATSINKTFDKTSKKLFLEPHKF